MSKRAILAVTFVAALAAFMVVQGAGARTDAKPASAAASGCQLNSAKGNIKHVIYIQFDNTHFRRDNANVPSDLEQMPHLLNFMKSNGTLLTNDHTVLISHTAGGILSSLTGVYPDRHGQIVSNSNVRFNGTGFAVPELVRLLDGSGHRDDDRSEHGHADRAERAGAVGAVHERGLQLRRGRDGEHRAREHRHRSESAT